MLRSPIHYKNVGVHTTERAHSKVQQQGDPKIGPGRLADCAYCLPRPIHMPYTMSRTCLPFMDHLFSA